MVQIAKLFGLTRGISQKKNFLSIYHGLGAMKQNVFCCSVAPPFGQSKSFLLPGKMHTNYTYPPNLVSLGLTVSFPQQLFFRRKRIIRKRSRKIKAKTMVTHCLSYGGRSGCIALQVCSSLCSSNRYGSVSVLERLSNVGCFLWVSVNFGRSVRKRSSVSVLFSSHCWHVLFS